MKNDAHPPPAIPPGTVALMTPRLIEFVRMKARSSGLYVDSAGRLAIMLDGEGVVASFINADQMRAAGSLLLAAADDAAAREEAAATESAEELRRVVECFAASGAALPAERTPSNAG